MASACSSTGRGTAKGMTFTVATNSRGSTAAKAGTVASVAMRREQVEPARSGLIVGGALALAFLVGQWFAWQQLQAAGYYAAGNPANAFFYVLTGLHGLHLLGGLVVWGRTVSRLSRGSASPGTLRLSVELCTVYWHYLLVVWLVLFGLLMIT